MYTPSNVQQHSTIFPTRRLEVRTMKSVVGFSSDDQAQKDYTVEEGCKRSSLDESMPSNQRSECNRRRIGMDRGFRAKVGLTVYYSLMVLVLLALSLPAAQAVACTTNKDCEAYLRNGSECWDGQCTNPYAKGGCLANHLPDQFTKLRTCNSEDSLRVLEQGDFCRPSELDYIEIRLGSQNWDGAFFIVWILQVLLSELLDVPVSVETGLPDKHVNFYHEYSAMDYGNANDFDGMVRAKDVKDCRNMISPDTSVEDYQSCHHILPELWSGKHLQLREGEEAGNIESPYSLGALGEMGWFLPTFTGARDPTLLHHRGLMGEENRRKLAERFLRPTNWKDYCEQVSPNACRTDDGIAARPPNGTAEESSYFVEGWYTGHFRKTEKNDCDKHPTTCTGHIVDFPCGWSSFVKANAYHLGIALESNGPDGPDAAAGYLYGQMTQIWAAANATQSDVMMQWWTPDALVQTYDGTDAEFQRVTLTKPTQTCMENRMDLTKRCGGNITEQLGDPSGACDEPPHVLQKILSTALYEITEGSDIPEALHNPAYQALKTFVISDLQVNDILSAWLAKGDRDKWNFDPREATCEWIVDNLSLVQAYVPRSHPRVLQVDSTLQPTFYVATALATIALILCGLAIYFTYRFRTRRVMRYSQLEFLCLLLVGLFLVSLGGLAKALQPIMSQCAVVMWLINMGYTLALVPLMIKMAAINRLMNAAARMKRVQLRQSSLFGGVVLISALVASFLIVWTISDPPRKQTEYSLAETQTPNGETVVIEVCYCASDSDIWRTLSLAWQLVLLICGTVLAFQTRNVREEINETHSLAMMIYSHFVFVGLQCLLNFLESSLDPTDVEAIRSIIYSADAIGVLVIYFGPKLLACFKKDDETRWSSNRRSSGMWQSNMSNLSQMSAQQSSVSAWIAENNSAIEQLRNAVFRDDGDRSADSVDDQSSSTKTSTPGQDDLLDLEGTAATKSNTSSSGSSRKIQVIRLDKPSSSQTLPSEEFRVHKGPVDTAEPQMVVLDGATPALETRDTKDGDTPRVSWTRELEVGVNKDMTAETTTTTTTTLTPMNPSLDTVSPTDGQP